MKIVIISNNEGFIDEVKDSYKNEKIEVVKNMKEASKNALKDLRSI